VVEDTAVDHAAQVDLVDLAVVRPGVLDGAVRVVFDEGLVGQVHQQTRINQRLPVGRCNVRHVRLCAIGEAEQINHVQIIGAQTGLGSGAQVVGVHDSHVNRDVRVGVLEFAVEVIHEVHQRWILVNEDSQCNGVLSVYDDAQQQTYGQNSQS